jgi:GT2 family glycosyltransferase
VHPTTVVIATRNRWPELHATLGRLEALADPPPVIVVDNWSSDATPALVRRHHPAVTAVALPANFGAAARTVGARLATTPWVALCDDDSWWDPGSLEAADGLLSGDPRIALLAARVVVEPAGSTDPTSELMARGARDEWLRPAPAGRRGVTGFLACAAVLRRSAFLAAGGFCAHFVIGGEEELVSVDLAASGWKLVYAPELTARHRPSVRRQAGARSRRIVGNSLLTAALRYGGRSVAGRVAHAALAGDASAWGGLGDAARSAGWALARRRRVGAGIEEAFVTGED